MILFRSLYCLLLLAPVAFAADDSNAVNERIPVTRLEMERHWQVDCTASWGQLKQVAQVHQDCEVASGLLRQLQLCAFIYQPPGSAAAASCPDYQAAYRAAGQGDCLALGLLHHSGAECLY